MAGQGMDGRPGGSPGDGRRDDRRAGRRNGLVALSLVGIVAGMVGLTAASVPLYRLFCQVTGFGGTTRVADAAPEAAVARAMTIRFNADVDPALPWRFQPEQRAVELKVGEEGLAFYRARNTGTRAVTGTAVFNVTPLKAGRYFNKVQCFCFTEQRLAAGEEVEMAVSFFVDPSILDDRNLDDVSTITLSYTFFPKKDADGGDGGEGSGDQAAARLGPAPGRGVN